MYKSLQILDQTRELIDLHHTHRDTMEAGGGGGGAENEQTDIIIVGGGICGLATALAFHRCM